MGLWGVTTAATDKPKFLPDDSNAVGAGGAKEHAIAVKGGWGLAPGQAFSGNDNTDADPEILVCVKNLTHIDIVNPCFNQAGSLTLSPTIPISRSSSFLIIID